MYCKLALATLVVIIGNDFATAQQIPSTTTAAEMWNPWTWFWPYAIASAEGYRDYYQKAQKATNELYQQIYKTNAFPWITGNWGPPQSQPKPSENGEQSNQEGQNTENEAGGPSNSTQNNETTSQNPAQEGETTQGEEKNEENQTEAESTGAQVQGNVQDDGTAEAEVKPN